MLMLRLILMLALLLVVTKQQITRSYGFGADKRLFSKKCRCGTEANTENWYSVLI